MPELSDGSPPCRFLEGVQTCVIWLLSDPTVFAALARIMYLTLVLLLVMTAIVVNSVGSPVLGLVQIVIRLYWVTLCVPPACKPA